MEWRREVLVVPTRLLRARGGRGEGGRQVKFRPSVPGCFGSNECEVPAVRAGLLRSRPQPRDHALGMPRLGYTDPRDPKGWLRYCGGYWICPGICPDTHYAFCFDARR